DAGSVKLVDALYSEKREAQEQKSAVQAIARMEVCLAALRYKVVLDILAHNATGIETSFGSDIGLKFKDLKSKDTIEKLSVFNLLLSKQARPRVGDMRTLPVFISNETTEFIDLTNLALAKYSSFLDKKLILQATQLASHNITRRFMATAEQSEQMVNNGHTSYPGLWEHEVEDYPFIVDLLERLLKNTGMHEEVMACDPPEFFKNTYK
ncbi:hypothetical protein C1S86_19935, partial [Vibrio parahaemolyticus]